MKRRNFLRDIALGIAATLVPKILQPVLPEVAEEEGMVDIEVKCYTVGYDSYIKSYTWGDGNRASIYRFTKEQADLVAKYKSQP